MKQNKEIQKAFYDGVEVIKESVSQVVMQQIAAAGDKGIRREDLPRVLTAIRASIEQNYHNSARNLDKIIAKSLDEGTVTITADRGKKK